MNHTIVCVAIVAGLVLKKKRNVHYNQDLMYMTYLIKIKQDQYNFFRYTDKNYYKKPGVSFLILLNCTK